MLQLSNGGLCTVDILMIDVILALTHKNGRSMYHLALSIIITGMTALLLNFDNHIWCYCISNIPYISVLRLRSALHYTLKV